jgi:hypothetical protein
LQIAEGQSNNYLKFDLSAAGIVVDGLGVVPDQRV